jgi:hypothetical protein
VLLRTLEEVHPLFETVGRSPSNTDDHDRVLLDKEHILWPDNRYSVADSEPSATCFTAAVFSTVRVFTCLASETTAGTNFLQDGATALLTGRYQTLRSRIFDPSLITRDAHGNGLSAANGPLHRRRPGLPNGGSGLLMAASVIT